MIKLKLIRKSSEISCTIGELFINDEHVCFTLEDVVREIPNKSVEEWKVKGKTAIPQGIYSIIITQSPKFNRLLPLLLSVPGFEGVRIHPGNTSEDTEGCILVGEWDHNSELIEKSRKTFDNLMDRLYGQSDISIEIINHVNT